MIPLAPQGVFRTIQGEGSLAGKPMTFIRLAGCSVGCPQCDTDYSLKERVSVEEIVRRCKSISSVGYVFITGGEPTDLGESLNGLINKLVGFRVAVATSGVRDFKFPTRVFVSCSPHSVNFKFRMFDEIKLVPGLNGLSFSDCDNIATWPSVAECLKRFMQPMDGSPIQPCIEWVERHPGWRLSIQTHKVLGLP